MAHVLDPLGRPIGGPHSNATKTCFQFALGPQPPTHIFPLGVSKHVFRRYRQQIRNMSLTGAPPTSFRCSPPPDILVYPAEVKLIFPIAGRGRPRERHIPDLLSIPSEDMLADAKWKNVSWRLGTKGKLKARFAAVRVRTADGPPQRIKDMGQQHLPGEEAWLIGEHRSSGEKKYYLANLPAATDLRTLAATIKARWICEQAHQQLKEELGLITSRDDPGKAFIVMTHDHDRLRIPPASPSRTSGAEKKINGPPPSRACQPYATPSSN